MTAHAALAHRQLAAIEAFNRARREAQVAGGAAERTRELRMDHDRRREVLQRKHEALIARAQQQLRESGEPAVSEPSLRAVVSHRNAWFADRLCEQLAALGVEVIDRVENGADTIGIAIAEQPELVFMEERLLMVPGEEVIRDLRVFSPETRISVRVEGSGRVQELRGAGAHSVATRMVPPGEVAELLLATL